MERQNREIYEEEESDDDVTRGNDSGDDELEYCYASIPATHLQPRKVLSKARWVSEMGMGEVEVQKGVIWRTTGIVRCGKIYGSVEELLFFAELGALLLSDENGVSLSIEDMYMKLSDEKNGCCWDYFQAYRQLKSLGYIVGRHGLPWSLKSVNCNNESSFSKGSVENVEELKLEDEVAITGMLSRMEIEEATAVFDVYPPNSKFKKSCPGDPSFVLCFTRGYPPSKATLEVMNKQCKGVPLKFCHVEQGKEEKMNKEKNEMVKETEKEKGKENENEDKRETRRKTKKSEQWNNVEEKRKKRKKKMTVMMEEEF